MTLEAVAIARGGFLSRSQLLDCGNSDLDIREAIATGTWTRIQRGYFGPTGWLATLTPEQRYVVRIRVAVDRFGDRVVVSHASACAVRGRALYGHDLSVVHVTGTDGRRSRREAGVWHHVGEIDQDRDVELVDGIACTSEPRALWETAMMTSIEGGMVTFDSGLHVVPALTPALDEIASVYTRWPESRHARIAYRLADGRSESAGETRGRHLFWRFAIPRRQLQHEVFDSDGRLIGRTDYAWLDGRHLGEFDGLVKYQRNLRTGESASDVVVREKSREDALRGQGSGAGMSRLVWADLDARRQPVTAQRIQLEIDRSARLYTRNRVTIC